MGKCIYVDAEKNWWIAETDSLVDGIIFLKEKRTEDFKKIFTPYFMKSIADISPQIIFYDDEENINILSAKGRKIRQIHQ